MTDTSPFRSVLTIGDLKVRDFKDAIHLKPCVCQHLVKPFLKSHHLYVWCMEIAQRLIATAIVDPGEMHKGSNGQEGQRNLPDDSDSHPQVSPSLPCRTQHRRHRRHRRSGGGHFRRGGALLIPFAITYPSLPFPTPASWPRPSANLSSLPNPLSSLLALLMYLHSLLPHLTFDMLPSHCVLPRCPFLAD